MGGTLAAILIPIGVIVAIGAIVYIVSRVRTAGLQEISVHSLLVFYFYLMVIVSLVVTTVGLSTLVKAGLATGLGMQFSYYRPYFREPVPAIPPDGKPGVPPQPSPEEQKAQQNKQTEFNFRNDILQGASAAVIGGLAWLVHVYGRRRIESEEERRESLLNRAYLFLMLAVFSVVGIVSSAQGIYETLRFYLIQPVDQYAYQSPPGGTLAMAIVFVPVWAYYLSTLAREWRRKPAK